MTAYACPTPDLLWTTPTRGHYIVMPPADLTTVELLDRIARRLLEPVTPQFSYRAEMARHRAYRETEQALAAAKQEAAWEAHRAALAAMNRS